MCLKNRKKRPLKLKYTKEWMGSLGRVVRDRSSRGSGLTKKFRFNSISTESIGKFLGKESIVKLLKFLKGYSACH